MIILFICFDCQNIFEEEGVWEEDSLEHFGTPCQETLKGCPSCYSTSYGKAIRCMECGEYVCSDYIELKSGARVCEDCFIYRQI